VSIKTAYTARFTEKVSVGAQAAYFIRTDTDADLDRDSSSRFLGGEVYSSAVWAFDSTIRFTAGAGAFFPQLGGDFKGDAPVRWKLSAGVLASL
jgi:hypothetical protein